jgi:hypothetical protein
MAEYSGQIEAVGGARSGGAELAAEVHTAIMD